MITAWPNGRAASHVDEQFADCDDVRQLMEIDTN